MAHRIVYGAIWTPEIGSKIGRYICRGKVYYYMTY